MKLRFAFHTGEGPDWRKGKWRWFKSQAINKGIIGWTWILAAAYSVPKLFRTPPKGSTRWKEYTKAFRFNFSHVEVWFPDENGKFWRYVMKPNPHKGYEQYKGTKDFTGQCFSATTRGNAKGVRFAPASEVLHHPKRWMYQEYKVDENKVAGLISDFKCTIGQPYDYWGIFGFFQPFNTQKDEQWYCSEICANIAWRLGIANYHLRISPRRLAMVLGGELKPVK